MSEAKSSTKIKGLILPLACIIATVIAIAIFIGIFTVAKAPVVKEKEFNYSVSYEYNGEASELTGTVKCKFSHVDYSLGEYEIYWDCDVTYYDKDSNDAVFFILDNEDESIYLTLNFDPAYLMGNPGYELPEDGLSNIPYATYYDKKVENMESTETALLAEKGFVMKGWEYPTPIENSLETYRMSTIDRSFAIPMVIIAAFAILACVVFVKKDKNVVQKPIDRISKIFNFIIGFAGIPFLTLAASMIDINGDAKDPISQIIIFLPALTALTLAAAISLRRKGFSVAGMVLQFVGPALLVVLMMIDFVTYM